MAQILHVDSSFKHDAINLTWLLIVFVALQVLLPLIDQYFKNHSLYFLSSPNKNLSSSGYASNKEKEMVTRYPFS